MITKNQQRQVDAISEAMREVYESIENKMMQDVNLTLMEGVNNPNTWENVQLAKRKKLEELLTKEANEAKNILNKANEKIEKIVDAEISVNNNDPTNLLVLAALSYHYNSINRIKTYQSQIESKRNTSEISNSFKPNYEDLYKAIYKQTQLGIKNGLQITYKNGRRMGYREYMEMNVRTTVQQDVSNQVIKSGKENHIVFYLCNFYGDCAKDHADYQGKYYYDEDWTSFGFDEETTEKISNYISRNRLLSVQFVRDSPVYLTTRPNCRHNLIPVSIDQVLDNSAINLTKKLNIHEGTYKPEHYEKMQQQRKNELIIRNYKAERNQNIEIYKQNPSELVKRQIERTNSLTKKWEAQQRQLLRENPYLERDYRRETKDILIKDLGVRYNL